MSNKRINNKYILNKIEFFNNNLQFPTMNGLEVSIARNQFNRSECVQKY